MPEHKQKKIITDVNGKEVSQHIVDELTSLVENDTPDIGVLPLGYFPH